MRAFQRHAREIPETPAVIHARETADGLVEDSLTYGRLDHEARLVATALRKDLAPGDRVLLLHPEGLEFARTFIGCLYAGLVPVVAPPHGRNPAQRARTEQIIRDAGCALLLAPADERAVLLDWLDTVGLHEVAVGATDSAWFDGGVVEPAAFPVPEAEHTAFLQYTSGSTSAPRGVVVSHGNVAHNARQLIELFGWTADMRFCSWLPMFHDMGLIQGLLTPLVLGATTVHFAPAVFLKRPCRWLELISRHRAAVSAAPNFAYELCARRVTDDQLTGLDLSSWQVAGNGSEPIDWITLERFAERFASVGFRASAFATGYGLAESTLAVTGTPLDEAPVGAVVDRSALSTGTLRPAEPGRPDVRLVSSGRVGDYELRIVDPATGETLPDGSVGEIWIRGGSVAQGYWRKPEETARVFHATAADGTGPFLRTGDLGALLDDRLYVTGRLKDTIVLNGRNIYPHDIERMMSSLDPAFGGLPAAAFAVQGGRFEEIAVVQELRVGVHGEEELRALVRRTKAVLGADLGVPVGSVALVETGQVPRTTSGKIQRVRARELLLGGGLKVVHEELSRDVAGLCRARAAESV
ncbi:fatty acyl-AMP ligase [Kitasatospora sp. NPDC097643]|uniref:fatty acyl-AMP ligase n=1 Tax=Kitasatospora sp. NPDC097643 TaxID=3157230 RepID=UPI00331997AC